MASSRVFTRATSGLVRELSIFDAAIFGLLYMVPLSCILYLFPTSEYYVPGADIPLAIVLAIVVMVPVYILYAGLGSAMPRAGGDYIYQSRTLHPAIGFSMVLSWNVILNNMMSVALCGLVTATAGFSPVLTEIGLQTGNQSLVELGAWASSPVGIFTLTILGGIIPGTLIMASGARTYRIFQRYFLFPGIIITTLGASILFAWITPEQFVNSFNAWGLRVAGDPDFYHTVINSAVSAGYTTPAFSWRATLITFGIVEVYLIYSVGSAMGLLGEVKKAGNFGLLFVAFLGAGLYAQFLMLFSMMWTFQRVVGWDFMHALSYAYYNGLVSIPTLSYNSMVAMLVGSNPVALIIISWGFLQAALYSGTGALFLNSRQVVAMSLDGAIPEWFGRMNRRFHSPVNILVLLAIIGVVLAFLLDFWSDFYFVVINGYLFAAIAYMVFTALAGILLRWRAPRIFKSAPAARYGWLLPIASAVAFIEILAISIAYLVFPEFGLNIALGWSILLGLPAVMFVYFFAWRAYQKRKGIMIDLAFKEIPPE